jgi:hypothetical protein
MTGVIVSSDLVVSPGVDGINGDNPLIGYQTLVAAGNVTATTADPDWPASNLANPSTFLKWKADPGSPVADEYLTVIPDTADDIDYVGIAGHNFGSGQMPVSIEYLDETASPPTWTELIGETLLPDDGPALFRFTPQPLAMIRVRIQPSLAAVPVAPAVAAVLYVGKLLVLQRRIFVGHTPIPYGRRLTVANHRSIAGAFLGRIVLSETTETSVDLQNLTPAWYRSYFEPFLVAAKEIPFFFAWRPAAYPREIGFAWLTGDPQPANEQPNGLMQVSFEMAGIVK